MTLATEDLLNSVGSNGRLGYFCKLKQEAKKDIHDPDNHDGVITHLEPDMLECEVNGP